MTGFSRLALTEAKLFLREKAALLGVFGLPVALVIGFGLIPGFSDPQKSLSGRSAPSTSRASASRSCWPPWA
jgi:ABC-2 type transport system permease protein